MFKQRVLNNPLFQKFIIVTNEYFTTNKFLIVSNKHLQNFSLFGWIDETLQQLRPGDPIWH